MSASTVDLKVDPEQLRLRKPAPPSRQPSNSPSQKTAMPRFTKGPERSTIAHICSWVVDHQIQLSATLISGLLLVHYTFPPLHHYTNKFFYISYHNPRTGRHALGWDDIFFVFYWIIIFTGMRCAVMDYVLAPLAEWFGLKKRKSKIRFAEQAWIFLYYTTSWLVGVSIVYQSDYWMNLQNLWKDWPTREMDGFNKWYYLVQFAFWLQQIVVVNIEERRKDHWQMFTHHIITCALIFASYGYHFTKVGTLILVLMDVVDLFLPLAKILRYLSYRTACDITFGVFMVTWLISRHLLYMRTWWSAYTQASVLIASGCYIGSDEDLQGPFPIPDGWSHVFEPFRNPVGRVCYSQNVQWTFLALLLSLQGVLCVWFYMIVRVAYKVITGRGAEDVRSDDEDSDDEDAEDAEKYNNSSIDQLKLCVDPRPFIELEVDSTDREFSASFNGRSRQTTTSSVRRSSRRRQEGSSPGVSILGGSSDRKELLGRIGCDKPSDD